MVGSTLLMFCRNSTSIVLNLTSNLQWRPIRRMGDERRLSRPSREASDRADNQGTTGAQPATNEVKTKGHIVIPYTNGLCESIKKIYGRCDIQTYFKGSNTIRNLLVSPKDKDPMVSKSGAIYWFQHGDLSCDDEYIVETSRTFGERSKSTWRTLTHSSAR